MKYKIGMMSLGCPKNQCDAELMLHKLHEAGWRLVEDIAKSDVAIVNTCGFIESAKAESIEEIIELGKLKDEGTIKRIVITGCLAERYRDEILEEMPEVDAVVGIGANMHIVDVCRRVLEGERFSLYGEKTDMPMDGGRVQTTPPFYAYLRVADGCDNRCAYCAIPAIRGGYRSRCMENIVAEAKELAASGVRELILVAQDTTRYGEDLYGENKLPELLDALCEIEGIMWIRLLYCYPDRVSDKLLETMARQPKIVKYMDIPLQHCNAEILRAMNRRGDKDSLLELIAKIRAAVPGIVLRTTMMVGFPGETRDHIRELAEFIREAKFERLGCFVWSAEEGTPAYDLPDRISEKEGNRRQEIIMEEQSRSIDAWAQSMIGKEVDVVAEGYDRLAECCFGRTMYDAPEIDGKVFFKSGGVQLTEGDIVRIRITDQMECDLLGERVSACAEITDTVELD
ncbi:MAG: 30S ribosomal protein S12 methylthiotransferase RimO [Clostridia bacterium]|nr:30S ribosomal protein S12 methylthiotransferase RimO [Clostridia bacterium]